MPARRFLGENQENYEKLCKSKGKIHAIILWQGTFFHTHYKIPKIAPLTWNSRSNMSSSPCPYDVQEFPFSSSHKTQLYLSQNANDSFAILPCQYSQLQSCFPSLSPISLTLNYSLIIVNGPKTKININPMVNCYSKPIMAILYISWLPLLQLGFLCLFITMQKEKLSQKGI